MIQTQSNPLHLNLYQPPEKILQSQQLNLQLMIHALETEEISKEFVVSIDQDTLSKKHWMENILFISKWIIRIL